MWGSSAAELCRSPERQQLAVWPAMLGRGWAGPLGGRCAEHDRLGVVQDPAQCDGDGWHAGKDAGCYAGHLLELLTGKPCGWPGGEGGHVQPPMRRHVKTCGERCQPLLSLLRKAGHL